MSLRDLSMDDIESLALGAWILGTGGGGNPYLPLLNMRALYRDGHRVQLMDAADLADDDWVGTETIRYGQRVTVIALPPPEVFLSEKGLAHVGPRAFGYDIDFRSVFA